MTVPTPPAVSEAMREAVARKLAELDGWINPDALWTDNAGMIARGFQGDPIWWDYREEADTLCAPAGPIASEIARLTGEMDAEGAVLTAECKVYRGLAEKYASAAEAAEAETARLRAALDAAADAVGRASAELRKESNHAAAEVAFTAAKTARAALSSQEKTNG